MHARQSPDHSGHGGEAPPTGGPRHALPPVPKSRKSGANYRLHLMPRSVRAKIVALLMVPVVSLIALWAFATVTTAQQVSDLNRFKEVDTTLLVPVGAYIAAVQEERATAARALAAPDDGSRRALRDRQRATDSAAAALRDGVNAGSADAAIVDPALPDRIDKLMHDADGLPALRKQDRHTTAGADRVIRGYTDTVEHGLAALGALTGPATMADASQGRIVLDLTRAREAISREDAVLGAAQVSGRMSRDQLDSFTGSVHLQRELFATAVDDLRPDDAAAYRRILDGPAYRELRAAEDAVRKAGAGAPPPPSPPAGARRVQRSCAICAQRSRTHAPVWPAAPARCHSTPSADPVSP